VGALTEPVERLDLLGGPERIVGDQRRVRRWHPERPRWSAGPPSGGRPRPCGHRIRCDPVPAGRLGTPTRPDALPDHDVGVRAGPLLGGFDPIASPDFGNRYFADPLLHLPVGHWSLVARADILGPDCSRPAHQLAASVEVTVLP
jgi:hypothetical protein